MKTCTTCKKSYQVSFFNKDKQKKDGLNPRCKSCSRAWHHKNKERVRDYQKEYYSDNREYHLERARNYRSENRDLVLSKLKGWQLSNKNKTLEYKSKKKGEYAAYARNRRSRIKGNGGTHTNKDILLILARQRNMCAICNARLDKYHVDHIYPIAKGGSNDPYNLQILCPPCNLSKNDSDPVEYAQRLGFLI